MKRTIEQARTFFKYTDRSKNEAYFTKKEDAKFCVDFAINNSPENTEWIEPFAGGGVFLDFLPEGTPAYDIEPYDNRIMQADSFNISWNNKVALTNIPFNLKKQCVQKALFESDFFWTIGPMGLLNMKGCWVDKVVLFEYGNWSIPRSYLKFDLPDGREKLIYCAFFKICREQFKHDVKLSSETWALGPTNIKQIDDRFYIRTKDGNIRKAII